MMISLLLQRFYENAGINSCEMALFYKEKSVTYAELLQQVDLYATNLAGFMKDKRNDAPICLLGDDKLTLIILQLAVLRVGHFFAVLDHKLNKSILKKQIEGLGSEVSIECNLNDESSAEAETPKEFLSVTQLKEMPVGILPESISDDSLAYVLLTSGSTGTPKAVMQTHLGLYQQMQRYYRIIETQDDDVIRFSNFAPLFHDQGIVDIYASLLAPHASLSLFDLETVYLKNDGVQCAQDFLKTQKITVFSALPDTFKLIFADQDKNDYLDLRVIAIGADVVKKEHLDTFLRSGPDGSVVINSYGTSECSWISGFKITKAEAEKILGMASTYIPIGVVDETLSFLIMPIEDKEAGEAPSSGVNRVGKLYIRGEGVSPGYFNDAVATGKAFVEVDGQLYFDTADQVKLVKENNENNNILLHIGRVDHLEKISGKRVDIDVLEKDLISVLKKTCVVVSVSLEKEKILCCFAINSDEKLKKVRWSLGISKKEIVDNFALHLRPSYLFEIAAFPKLAAGKIDREALRNMARDHLIVSDKEFQGSDIERLILSLAAKYHCIATQAEMKDISIKAINSISFSAFRSEINEALGRVIVDFSDYKETQTLALLASEIECRLTNPIDPQDIKIDYYHGYYGTKIVYFTYTTTKRVMQYLMDRVNTHSMAEAGSKTNLAAEAQNSTILRLYACISVKDFARKIKEQKENEVFRVGYTVPTPCYDIKPSDDDREHHPIACVVDYNHRTNKLTVWISDSVAGNLPARYENNMFDALKKLEVFTAHDSIYFCTVQRQMAPDNKNCVIDALSFLINTQLNPSLLSCTMRAEYNGYDLCKTGRFSVSRKDVHRVPSCFTEMQYVNAIIDLIFDAKYVVKSEISREQTPLFILAEFYSVLINELYERDENALSPAPLKLEESFSPAHVLASLPIEVLSATLPAEECDTREKTLVDLINIFKTTHFLLALSNSKYLINMLCDCAFKFDDARRALATLVAEVAPASPDASFFYRKFLEAQETPLSKIYHNLDQGLFKIVQLALKFPDFLPSFIRVFQHEESFFPSLCHSPDLISSVIALASKSDELKGAIVEKLIGVYNGKLGLNIIAYHAPKSLPSMIKLVTDSSSIIEKFARVLREKINEKNWLKRDSISCARDSIDTDPEVAENDSDSDSDRSYRNLSPVLSFHSEYSEHAEHAEFTFLSAVIQEDAPELLANIIKLADNNVFRETLILLLSTIISGELNGLQYICIKTTAPLIELVNLIDAHADFRDFFSSMLGTKLKNNEFLLCALIKNNSSEFIRIIDLCEKYQDLKTSLINLFAKEINSDHFLLDDMLQHASRELKIKLIMFFGGVDIIFDYMYQRFSFGFYDDRLEMLKENINAMLAITTEDSNKSDESLPSVSLQLAEKMLEKRSLARDNNATTEVEYNNKLISVITKALSKNAAHEDVLSLIKKEGVLFIIQHHPEKMHLVLEIARDDAQVKLALADSLTAHDNEWTGFNLIVRHAPVCLTNVMALAREDADFKACFVKALTEKNLDNSRVIGVHIVARHAPAFLIDIADMATKGNQPSINDFFDMLMIKNQHGWTGFHLLAYYAPVCLINLVQMNGEHFWDKFYQALTMKNKDGWTIFHILARYQPDYMIKFIEMVKNESSETWRDCLANALVMKNNNGWTVFHILVRYQSTFFRSLLELAKNEDDGIWKNKIAEAITIKTKADESGLSFIVNRASSVDFNLFLGLVKQHPSLKKPFIDLLLADYSALCGLVSRADILLSLPILISFSHENAAFKSALRSSFMKEAKNIKNILLDMSNNIKNDFIEICGGASAVAFCLYQASSQISPAEFSACIDAIFWATSSDSRLFSETENHSNQMMKKFTEMMNLIKGKDDEKGILYVLQNISDSSLNFIIGLAEKDQLVRAEFLSLFNSMKPSSTNPHGVLIRRVASLPVFSTLLDIANINNEFKAKLITATLIFQYGVSSVLFDIFKCTSDEMMNDEMMNKAIKFFEVNAVIRHIYDRKYTVEKNTVIKFIDYVLSATEAVCEKSGSQVPTLTTQSLQYAEEILKEGVLTCESRSGFGKNKVFALRPVVNPYLKKHLDAYHQCGVNVGLKQSL